MFEDIYKWLKQRSWGVLAVVVCLVVYLSFEIWGSLPEETRLKALNAAYKLWIVRAHKRIVVEDEHNEKDFGVTPQTGGDEDNGKRLGENIGSPTHPLGPLVARAIVSKQQAKVGEVVTWTTEGEGGNGYYSFYWFGTDGLESLYQTTSATYAEPGTKVGYVEMTSDGETIVRRAEMTVVK